MAINKTTQYITNPDTIPVNTATGTEQLLPAALDDRWISGLYTVSDMVAATNLTIGDRIRTSGYAASGDAGGNDYEVVAAGTGTDDGGSFIDLTGSGLQARGLFTQGTPNARQFGAGNSGDDTTAINALYSFSDNIRFPDGEYRVTSLTWSGSGKRIVFEANARIFGASEDLQDQILRLHNFRNSRIFNLRVESDGNEDTPLYQHNYGCAVRLTSDNGSSPTQFLTIDGMWIKYIKSGFVSGNLLGDPAQPSFPQSEIFIRDYRVRGVMQAMYSNAINGYITTSGSVFVTQQFESTGWWDDSDAFNMSADAGDIVSVGDEFQAARSDGLNIAGKGIKIYSPVWEHTCTNLLTGSVSIEGMSNGFFGSSSNIPFTIESGTEGRLLLTDCTLRRPDGTASSSRSVFCDCKDAPDFDVSIVNSYLKEFAFITNSSNAHFVLGGILYTSNLTVDNSASSVESFRLNDSIFSNTSFDTTGESMSDTQDFSSKGGWSGVGSADGASFFKYTADTPDGFDSAIRFVTTGTSKVVQTPGGSGGFPIQSNRDYLFSCLLKRLGTVSNFTVIVQWYDFGGNSLSVDTVFAHDDTRLDLNGFDKWQRLGALAKPPSGATHARISLSMGSTCDVALTGIKMS